MASLLAIAQMTPGPIAINSATFVGYRIAGVLGSALASLAVIAPSVTILILLAPFIDKISKNTHVLRVRHGIQIGVLSLILYATWSYGSIAVQGWFELLIALISLCFLIYYEGKLHPIFVILAGGVCGLIFF
jgi:chromate transporter